MFATFLSPGAKTLSGLATATCLLCLAGPSRAAEDDDLTILDKDSNRLLYTLLLEKSAAIYQARDQEVRKALASPETIKKRAERLRNDYLKNLGDLPSEKCPLNARTTGTVDCGDYRIDNVLFESRPNHRVTANVYVPSKGPGPFPGILIPCGHSPNGKIGYHPVGALFAQHGFVAIIYDPICQGERHQTPGLKPTTGHSLIAPGSFLVGRTVTGYEAWDGIRALDYLLTLDEVDKTKAIGMTGNSGGGCQTNFLMALDERIGPAAPSCFVMRKHRKFQTLGPGDGCQSVPDQVKHGIDHADMTWIRAPRPTLVMAAKRDYVDFKSTVEATTELQELYTAIGAPDNTGLFSYDDKHGFSKPRREAAVAWMKRWLKNDDSPVVEGPLRPLSAAELVVTDSHQVLEEFEDEQSIMQLNHTRAIELAGERAEFWQGPQGDVLAEIKHLVGSRKTAAQKARLKAHGTVQREGYQIEKLIIQGPDDLPLPALLFLPRDGKKNSPAFIVASDRGKADKATLEKAEELVRAGNLVLSIDLRGYGETTDRMCKRKNQGRDYGIAALSLQLGLPLLGQRVDDLMAAADIMLARSDVASLGLIGIGKAGPVALHAAAFDTRFSSLKLERSLSSWTEAIDKDPDNSYMVFGALKKYDLPDLAKSIEARGASLTRIEKTRD